MAVTELSTNPVSLHAVKRKFSIEVGFHRYYLVDATSADEAIALLELHLPDNYGAGTPIEPTHPQIALTDWEVSLTEPTIAPTGKCACKREVA